MPNFKRSEYVAFTIAIVVAIALAAAIALPGTKETPSTPTPVSVVVRPPLPPGPSFQPIRILNLDVKPRTIQVGEPATLINGICNDASGALGVQFYLGAQLDVRDPLMASTIDFVGQDTEAGRHRVTFLPGCHSTDPITRPLPLVFTSGMWRLRLHIIAIGPAGEIQNLERVSDPFIVQGGN